MMSSIATVVVVVVEEGEVEREEGVEEFSVFYCLFICLSCSVDCLLTSRQGGKGERKEGSGESTLRPWEPNYIVPRSHVWENR